MSLKLPIEHSKTCTCTYCGNEEEYNFKIEDINFEDCTERGMGPETMYSYTVELHCKVCGKIFDESGEVWEYPEGFINHID